VARSGDAAVTVLLGVSSLSNDRRQEWHENRRRDQNSRYSMCFTKTVLSDRIAEFQVKSLVALMGMLPRACDHSETGYNRYASITSPAKGGLATCFVGLARARLGPNYYVRYFLQCVAELLQQWNGKGPKRKLPERLGG